MSDPMKAKGIIVVEDWIDESALGSWRFLTWEDMVAAVRAGVDVGTIKGEEMEWCEPHRVELKMTYADGYDGPRECQDSPYFDGDCRIVAKLLIPVSDGGSET